MNDEDGRWAIGYESPMLDNSAAKVEFHCEAAQPGHFEFQNFRKRGGVRDLQLCPGTPVPGDALTCPGTPVPGMI